MGGTTVKLESREQEMTGNGNGYVSTATGGTHHDPKSTPSVGMCPAG